MIRARGGRALSLGSYQDASNEYVLCKGRVHTLCALNCVQTTGVALSQLATKYCKQVERGKQQTPKATKYPHEVTGYVIG